MRYKKGKHEIVLRLDEGEEIMEMLTRICKKENIENAIFSGIGATREIEIAHFDTKEKKYNSKITEGMFEIVSLNGNVTLLDDEPLVHAHIIVANADFTSYGGHLVRAVISPTCEIAIIQFKTKIKREKDEKTGLNLLKL
ncbi:DNA-binding protein [Candidatus Micrarchaeota archaeon]|nr:DNA-binding protein [Candidatus Micrarchaeota archaeon]